MGSLYHVIKKTFYNILLCQSSQGHGYIWQVKGYKILCHFINMADKWCLVDGQQLQMWFGTFSHTCTGPQGIVLGNCHLQGRQLSPWGRSLMSFEQIGPDSLFRGSQVKGPSSLALLRMVPHKWPVALAVIWHIYSCLAYSSEDSAKDLPSSGKVVLGQGQVPCEFQADWPRLFSGEFEPRGWAAQLPQINEGGAQLTTPDMIWHIYSHLYCSSRDGGRDLPSSGRQPLPWWWSPVSFGQITLGLVLQGKSWDKGPSSLALPWTVHRQLPVVLDVISHIN